MNKKQLIEFDNIINKQREIQVNYVSFPTDWKVF